MIRRSLPALFLLALTAMATACLADGLTARISTDKIALGDTFQLTLSADPTDLTAAPDISALNPDFHILGTSKSSQTRIINGDRSETVTWSITLEPRKTGHLAIPVLTAGSVQTAALSLDVVDAADLPPETHTAGGTAITAELEPGAHYVQQEIPLTLRITTGPDFRDGMIEPPASPDFVLERRGQDRISAAMKNGQPVTMIERDYLLRPQKSGALRVPPFTLRGIVNDPATGKTFPSDPFASLFGRSPFGGAGSPFGRMLTPARPVAVRSQPLTLDIKAKPDTAADWFLPAKDVTLSARWEPETPAFRVGDAVTRRVRITALGATNVQLPDLALPEVAGTRVYLDRSQSGMIDTPGGPAAVRDFSYSIVPTGGGTLTLPEVTLRWFDTATETSRIATLPAETITVEGPVVADVAGQSALESTAPAVADSANHLTNPRVRWPWPLSAIIVILILGTAILWRYHGDIKSLRGNRTAPSQRHIAMARIATACAAQDPQATYSAALEWLNAVDGDSQTDADALFTAYPDLRTRWQELEVSVFSEQARVAWDAAAFLTAVRAADRTVGKRPVRHRVTILPPLYMQAVPRNLSQL